MSKKSKSTPTPTSPLSPLERFIRLFSKHKGDNACWPFSILGTNGYGVHSVNGRSVAAHRYAYEQAYENIPSGMCIRHSCHNRACVRPSHLSIGTKKDNSEDMVRAGRSSRYIDRKPRTPLSPADRALVIKRRAKGDSVYAIAKDLGRSQPHIHGILRTEANRKEREQRKPTTKAAVLKFLHDNVEELSALTGTPVKQPATVIEMPKRKRDLKKIVAIAEGFQGSMKAVVDEFNPKSAA